VCQPAGQVCSGKHIAAASLRDSSRPPATGSQCDSLYVAVQYRLQVAATHVVHARRSATCVTRLDRASSTDCSQAGSLEQCSSSEAHPFDSAPCTVVDLTRWPLCCSIVLQRYYSACLASSLQPAATMRLVVAAASLRCLPASPRVNAVLMATHPCSRMSQPVSQPLS
jgi:hypothetical protein